MIDKSLPYHPLYLFKTDTKQFPKYDLPDGYRFAFYKKGDEKHWAELECSLGQFDCIEKGLESFQKEFIIGHDLSPEERMIFVIDGEGEYVATASLWYGMYLGEKCQRVHWVAVSDKCTGKGIAKALMSRILELYNELGFEGFIYLVTATWYYPAVSIYKKYGFEIYAGDESPSGNKVSDVFKKDNETAIALVNEKLAAYSKPRN